MKFSIRAFYNKHLAQWVKDMRGDADVILLNKIILVVIIVQLIILTLLYQA
jgi:hypothetical protein